MNTQTKKIKPSFNLVAHLQERFDDFDYYGINGIEDLDLNFLSVNHYLNFFNEDDYTTKILNACYYTGFKLIEYKEVLESISVNIGIYSKFHLTDFETEDEYNDAIREHTDDFVKYAQNEVIFYTVNFNSTFLNLELNLKNELYERNESQAYIEREINKIEDVIKRLLKSFEILEEAIKEINQSYEDINNGYFIPELSSSAHSVLYFHIPGDSYDVFMDGYNYQCENKLIEKEELKQRLNNKLIKNNTKIKTNKI